MQKNLTQTKSELSTKFYKKIRLFYRALNLCTGNKAKKQWRCAEWGSVFLTTKLDTKNSFPLAYHQHIYEKQHTQLKPPDQ